MRTIDATLQAALASGSYTAYFRAYFYVDFNDVSPSFTMTTVSKYKLTGTTLTLEGLYNYAEDDFNQLGWVVLSRGVTIAGVNYTLETSRFSVKRGKVDGNFLRIEANLLPDTRISFLSDTFTYEQAIEEFCIQIGFDYDLAEPAETFWQNQFLPNGRNLTLNKATAIQQMLKQKAFINLCDNGNEEIRFYSAKKEPGGVTQDYTITVEDIVETIVETPQVFNRGLLWRDENNTTFQPADNTLALYNIGFLKTGDILPTDAGSATTLRLKQLPHLIEKVVTQINLNYQSGDRVKIISSITTVFEHGYLQVTEYLDTDKDLAWGLELTFWDYIGSNEGGTMPSTIEASAPYTPLNTSHFNAILDETDNNLQAAMETLDDHTHSLSTEEVQDIVGAMFSGNTETGIAATYDDSDGTIDLVAEVTQAELDAHTGDTSDAHDASAISIADAGGYITGTDVEAAIQELGASVAAAAINYDQIHGEIG